MRASRHGAWHVHALQVEAKARRSGQLRGFRSLVLLLVIAMVAAITAGNEARTTQAAAVDSTCGGLDTFSYREVLNGPVSSLSIWVQSMAPATGEVVINGTDSRQPTTPFTFDWGDGSVTQAFFPAAHTYSDTQQNYTVAVTAHYSDSTTGTESVVVLFQTPTASPVPLDATLQVTIPSSVPPMTTRLYPVPQGLVAFADGDFTTASRNTLEYLLSVGAQLQFEYAGGDVLNVGGGFNQTILRDPSVSGGMYSLWFTTPVAIAVQGPPLDMLAQISSLFHEMGHNVSLNSPAEFQFGGQIDGNANAIYSETMAQLLQHVTVLDMVRDGADFGLGCDLRSQIAASGLASLRVVRSAFDQYALGGMPYDSWNDPGTTGDETFGTFMALAYTFFAELDESGMDAGIALRRTMALLQTFGPTDLAEYAPSIDSPEASTFRSTLMVAALSHGLQEDMRQKFEDLNFPIDDATYERLLASMCVTVVAGVDPPGSGSVSVWPSPNCPGDPTRYIDGTVVALSPEPATGWFFSEWSGDLASGNANPLLVIANANKTVTANFLADGDESGHPIVMTSAEFSFELNAANATQNTGEPIIVSSPSCSFSIALEHTIWLKFSATQAGVLWVSTEGSSYDVVVAAFAGTPLSVNQVGCAEGSPPETSSFLSFETLPGMTYWVEFGSWQLNEVGLLHVESDWFASTDVNCTHETDVTDALVLLRVLAGLEATVANCPADVDRNGSTEIVDVLHIRRSVAGLLP